MDLEKLLQQDPHIIIGSEKIILALENCVKEHYTSKDCKNPLPVLVGSRACAVHGIEVGRDVSKADWDVLIPSSQIISLVKEKAQLFKVMWARVPMHTTSLNSTAVATVSGILHDDQKMEMTVLLDYLQHNYSGKDLSYEFEGPTCSLPTGDECKVASVALLHVIKESHLHVSVDWEKHIADLSIIKKHMTDEEALTRFRKFKILYDYRMKAASLTNNWKETKASDTTELSLVCPRYTFEGIDIRKEVAFPSNPQYYNFIIETNTLSRIEYIKSSRESHRKFVAEEAITVAIHNTLISLFPFDDETAKTAYKIGLRTLCTSPTQYHWFTKFIIDNYESLCSENTQRISGIVERIIHKVKGEPTPVSQELNDKAPRELHNNAEPYTLLYFLEKLLTDDYDALVALSLLNKGWNTYFKSEKLWVKWYHKRWGSFVKGTPKTDWRASYKRRLQDYELIPSRKTLAYPLLAERFAEIRKYNNELHSGVRQFVNLRALVVNVAMAKTRGAVNDTTGALYVKNLIPHTYVYEVSSKKVAKECGGLWHYMQTEHGALETRVSIVLIGQSAQPLEFTVVCTDFGSTYEYNSGDSDYRFDHMQWHQVQVEGKDKMQAFKYQSTESQLPAVLSKAAKKDCTLVGAEFNCPKIKDSDLLQYLIQLLPKKTYNKYMNSVCANLDSNWRPPEDMQVDSD